MICKICGEDFDFNPKRKYGRVTDCDDCATDVAKYTGVMVYGHKTAGVIQINSNPAITEYMLKSSPSSGTRNAMRQNAPKSFDGAKRLVDEVSRGK